MPLSSRLLLFLALLCAAPLRASAQTTEVTPLDSPAPASFFDDLFGRFLPRLGYSYDGGESPGREGGLSAFQAFLPVWHDRDSTRLLFSDSRLLIFDDRGSIGANLGVGGRVFSEALNRIVAGYVYWDYTDTGRASFNQVSGGVETLGDRIDARANFYLPMSKDRKVVEQTFTPASAEPYFQNNALVLGGGQGARTLEQALYGFDTEAGLRFFANDSLELRAFAGMYHYQAEQAAQAWGPRGRVEARLRDTLAMGLSVQNDRLFGTTVNLNVLMTFPRLSGRDYGDGSAAPLAAGDRLGDPVMRMQQVAVLRQQERYVVPGKAVVDPLTGQPFIFLHIAPGGSSDGSFENPYGSLTEAFADPRFARGNLIVYDRTQGAYVGNVRFAPGTRLLSSGPVQMIDVKNVGLVRMPFSGASPDLTKAPSIQGTVTIASQSVVSGFDFRAAAGSAAIAGLETKALRDVVIAGNRMTGGGTAVHLPNVAGMVVVQGNRIVSPAGSGVVIEVQGDGSATLVVRDNRVAGAGGQGAIVLEATGQSGSATLNATVVGNELPNNQSPGVTARAGGADTLELDLAGNTALSPRAMFGFVLRQQGPSTFRLVEPDTVGARNTGSVVTTGTITPLKSAR